MNNVMIYMIKASVCLAAFYMIYSLLLSRDTIHGRNRAYIIFSLVLSLVFPLINYQTSKPLDIQFFGKLLSEVFITADAGSSTVNLLTGIDDFPANLILYIYLAGVLVLLLRFARDIASLAVLIERHRKSGSRYIRYDAIDTAGFSALGYVFISRNLSPDEAGEIIKHEKNHLSHYHYIDIIFIEFITAFQWFNPFIHMFNRELRAIHEFQADKDCLRSGIPVISYQALLMNQVFRPGSVKLTNSFSNPSMIKKRMIMMTRQPSRMSSNLKLVFMLPVTAAIMILFSSYMGNPRIQDASQPLSAIPAAEPSLTSPNGDKVYKIVDKMPQFEGGDAALLQFIAKNAVYPQDSREKGISGKVIVSFIVGKDGTVSNASITNGVSTDIDAEALRIVRLLPAFRTPGIKDNKPVPVWFMIPINFSLQ